jgi:probable O-glycosylation ligase (exosortase A-associated)
MRDIILFIIFALILPVCFIRPWIGVLVFSWISYMNPHRFTWGYAYDFPFAKIIAIITIIGLLFTKDKMRLPNTRETLIIIILGIYFTFTNLFAFYQSAAWEQWEKVIKIFIMTLVTIILVNNKVKLRYLIMVIALSIGILGIKGGIFSILTGGEFRVYGPKGTFFEDNNDMALALNMVLPMLFFLSREEKNKNIKLLLICTFILSIISIVFTYSRGGFITLLAVISLLYFKLKHRVMIIPIFLIIIVISMLFIPEQWFTRIETIKTYEKSRSAIGRINAWKTAINVAKDKPLTGGGFEGLRWNTRYKYSPDPTSTALDVHSVYFEVLGEHGFIAFGLFIILLLSSLKKSRQLINLTEDINDLKWVKNYSNMFQISIIAYAVGGLFLGRAYFDLFYHIVAMVVITYVLTLKEINQRKSESVRVE